MKTKTLLLFAVAGLSIASAKSFTVMVPDQATVNGTPLAAGEYKVSVNGASVTLLERNTKNVVQANATVQTADRKFDNTSILSKTVDGKNEIDEIDLGGTKTKLEFNR